MSHLLSGGEGSLQLDGASSITRSTSYMPKNVVLEFITVAEFLKEMVEKWN